MQLSPGAVEDFGVKVGPFPEGAWVPELRCGWSDVADMYLPFIQHRGAPPRQSDRGRLNPPRHYCALCESPLCVCEREERESYLWVVGRPREREGSMDDTRA